jgi:hypothetical protein
VIHYDYCAQEKVHLYINNDSDLNLANRLALKCSPGSGLHSLPN